MLRDYGSIGNVCWLSVVGLHPADMCMVFEMLGDNLLTLIKAYKYRGIPVEIVRQLTRSVGSCRMWRCRRDGRFPCGRGSVPLTPLDGVFLVVYQVCIGLHFLHTRCRVIHTDLKPENVLLTRHIPPLPTRAYLRKVRACRALTFGASCNSRAPHPHPRSTHKHPSMPTRLLGCTAFLSDRVSLFVT